MLKALLYAKLGRVAVGVDEESDGDTPEEGSPQGTAADGLTELEDPLTSMVFERLEYLPAELAWAILRGACKPLGDGPPMPAIPPVGVPSGASSSIDGLPSTSRGSPSQRSRSSGLNTGHGT
ncbi:hypothetical protein [Sorangium sp. So ce861]|uniref:hypothetical protein n=1 Tax=Sorangium sp. So ce861 TaxID=3133323 RepID=UPI003F5FD4C0